jgi:hypothetical protein
MAKAKRAKPIPLTKEQLQSDAGQELLELAEAITEDGLVSATEVTRLHRWLHKRASEKLPAVDFLNDEVDQLRADEKEGGTWPRRRLHRALERVLPKALREEAKERRKGAESLAFHWGTQSAPRPAMRPDVPTLLLQVPDVPMRRIRAAVAQRLARHEMASADVLRDLADPPTRTSSKEPAPTSSAPVESTSEPAGRPTGSQNQPTLAPVARVQPTSEAVARSRYRGEIFWFEDRAWAVFTDPEDSDCRYAQVVS